MLRRSFLCAAIAAATAFIAGCDNSSSSSSSNAATQASGGGGGAGGKRTVTIGFIGKSQSNMVFKVAEQGARDAANELGDKYGVNIKLVVKTPADEDPVKQADAINSLVNIDGANAIILSASEAATLKKPIDDAVDKGASIMTFDSDVPDSKRFACYATNDRDAAFKLVDALAKSMNDTGTIAILAGNQSAPNLQARVAGVKEALQKHPNMKLAEPNAVFYHQETPEKAVEAISAAMNANPSIQGWALVGGWPLFTDNALKWEPGKVKVASIDALPQQLQYIRDGHVDVLFAQDCYGWGHKTVETVLDKLVNNKTPENPKMADPLTPITKANVEEWSANWKKWLPST